MHRKNRENPIFVFSYITLGGVKMFRIYTIQEGELLEEVANKFSTTCNEILNLNGFDDDYRAIGGDLVIVPNNDLLFRKYIVKKGDTIYEIAKKVGTSEDTLLKINGLDEDDYIYPNQEILIPAPTVMMYVTKLNDTLTDVASYFKTSKDNIIDMNDNLKLAVDQIVIYKK